MRVNDATNSQDAACTDRRDGFRELFKRESHKPNKTASKCSLVEGRLWISD